MKKQSKDIILAELEYLKIKLKEILNPMVFQENWNGAVECILAIRSADRLRLMIESLKSEEDEK